MAWLSGHAFLMLLDATVSPSDVPTGVAAAREAGLAGVVLYPSHLGVAGDTGELTVAAVVGYPSGRHHTLVKAAEARLAVAQGATEVWLTPDPTIDDPNTLLAEFVAVREAVPPPVTLAVYLESGRQAVAEAAALAGVDRLITGASLSGLPRTAPADTLEAVITALEQGADRVAVSSVAAVCPPPG
ncbi:MAG: hypothetical protein GX859_12175 [Corynebacterium humireducens]|jgi:deoxyribose-phosphate aldolase|uniref:Deoxyribose-phosphate aldolase n=1 Tax=Corynebacterium humireducens TaxID=1223514 RepID=A0A7X6PPZ2_9CORY|nr:hypothetical protein [Corynebacterium humireducens]